MASDLETKWRYLLGDELADFVLASDSVSDSGRGQRAEAALTWLESNAGHLRALDPRLAVALVKDRVSDVPRAWWLRTLVGGSGIERQGSDNAAEELLAAIADDYFPVMLAASDVEYHPAQFPFSPTSRPELVLDQLLEEDTRGGELNLELVEEAEAAGGLRFLTAITVESLSRDYDARALLAAACRRWRHCLDTEPRAFGDLALGALADVRALARGEEVEVTVAVGICGRSLPEATALELPQGILRSPAPRERGYIPLAFRADTVLEVKVTTRALDAADYRPELVAIEGERAHLRVREVLLAWVLAQSGPDRRGCGAIAWLTPLGVGEGDSAWRPPSPAAPPSTTGEASEAEVQAIGEWAERIDAVDLSIITVAVERLMSALWERQPADSLIDAVTAWEALVGTTSETSFRVTASLAVLCEADPAQRLSLRKHLGRIYNARSRCVHGETLPEDVGVMSAEAVDTAVRAVQIFIRDRPALLAVGRSSARADRLLLGVSDDAT